MTDDVPSASLKGLGGLVEVRLANTDGRTLLPTVANLYYTLEFTNESEAAVKATVEPSNEMTKIVTLKPGVWNLSVAGYLTAESADSGTAPLVSGAVENIQADAGAMVSINVELTAYQTASGTGTASFNITFPIETTAATLKWTRSGGEPVAVDLLDADYAVTTDEGVISSSGEISLSAAYYNALFTAKMGDGAAAAKRDVAHIFDGLTTLVEWVFTAGDFAETPDKTALTGLLADAASAQTGVVVENDSTNSSDVDAGIQWIKQSAATALATAIASAQAVADDSDADLEEILNAETALTEAIEAYSGAVLPGTKPVDKGALNTAITAATAAKSGVAIGTTPGEVAKDVVFVTQSVMDALNAAISAAQTAADADVYQPAVNTATQALEAAITTFNNAKQTGTNEDVAVADKSALNTAITNANTAKTSVSTATAGNEVPEGSQWVTAEELGALTSAISSAEAVVQNGSATQEQVDAAKTTLETAITTFNSAKKNGTQKAVTFSNLTVNGSETETTTVLTLTFSQDVTDLATSDITLSGSASATKGALTKTGTGVYTLGVTLESDGNVVVTVAKAGYAFDAPKSVTVNYFTGGGVTIIVENPVDQTLSVTADKTNVSRKMGETVTLTASTTAVEWLVEGKTLAGITTDTEATLTLNARDYTVGVHYATVIVTIDGKRYSKEVSFHVTN